MTPIEKAQKQLEEIKAAIEARKQELERLEAERARIEKAIAAAEEASAQMQNILERLGEDAKSLFVEELRQALPSQSESWNSKNEDDEEEDSWHQPQPARQRKVLSFGFSSDRGQYFEDGNPTSFRDRSFGFAIADEKDPDDIPF